MVSEIVNNLGLFVQICYIVLLGKEAVATIHRQRMNNSEAAGQGPTGLMWVTWKALEMELCLA